MPMSPHPEDQSDQDNDDKAIGPNESTNTTPSETNHGVLEYLNEARQDVREEGSGITFGLQRYGDSLRQQVQPESISSSPRAQSPVNSSSTQDDTPSIQGSLNSYASSSLGNRYSAGSPSSFSRSPSLRPFERRFQSRLSSSPSISTSSLLLHSRTSSVSSRVETPGSANDEDATAPWEVIKWTKLRKITQQAFSETARRSFGTPTCIAVSATIALGTTKGIILVFDYNQNIKTIIGLGTKAVESGAITAIAVSQDHTTLAGGHADGYIYTWELAKPGRPFLTIPPIPSNDLQNRKGDGHIEGVAVIHLGFLGTRHTALVSADERGMAFSHLATRGLGALGRTVKTTRLLGRYPSDITSSGKPRKPSSVLGFAVLPLGNAPQATDSMGLVAILTPYLLVVVSTTPIAQTQFKLPRPKEVASDAVMSGCLAWFPAVKLKSKGGNATEGGPVSKAMLAFCWSNALTVLELTLVETEEGDGPERPPILAFRTRTRWKCDEAIVAVQWLSRQIITVLTSTQRLFVLERQEDGSLRLTESFDLLSKHVMHHRTFAPILSSIVGAVDEEGSSHPSVADAFYNSFKTYKGKMFLLCQFDVSIGALSNWADRLLALMDIGDYIGAIQMATSFYAGETDRLTVGLPDDPKLRQPLVEEKLVELMSASIRYAFGMNVNSPNIERQPEEQLQKLAEVCFVACLTLNRPDYLFDEMYERFEDAELQGIFLETLEPYILTGQLTVIPPTVVKALVVHYTSKNLEERLEEIICNISTETMDVDQLTALCKNHKLYDALIYVWNRALGDYITPLIYLLELLEQDPNTGDFKDEANATKIFPYLAYTLTGRVYPKGTALSDDEAVSAKASLYYFLFVGRAITWTMYSSRPYYTDPDRKDEPFPYLQRILRFDAASFLSVMNEAFEDPFLNGITEQASDSPRPELSEDQIFGRSVNRQLLVTILLEVLGSGKYDPLETIFLDIFIARNLPKFPQYILLSGSALQKSLERLCNYPEGVLPEDCQLSVEYLLSVYHPPNVEELVALFSRARFYRVLKTIFRNEKQYARLLETYFDDEESRESIFDCIIECLGPSGRLTEKQLREVRTVIQNNARRLVDIDVVRCARTLESTASDLHGVIISAIEDRPEDQFLYLGAVLEPHRGDEDMAWKETRVSHHTGFVELYVRLMCRFEPSHVPEFTETLKSGELRLEEVLPAMEESGIVDAAVRLLAQEGKIAEAMQRLVTQLEAIEGALMAVLESDMKSTNMPTLEDSTKSSLAALKKYTEVGIWLCMGQTRSARGKKGLTRRRDDRQPLTAHENLWLNLIEAVVSVAKSGITTVDRLEPTPITDEVLSSLRTLVQGIFYPLLTHPDLSPSFLPIFRTFLENAQKSSPTLSSLRTVLQSIFSAYTYESSLLSLAQKLLEQSLFSHMDTLNLCRQRGWRPGSQTCEGCRERVWGPGVGGGIFEAWEKKRRNEAKAQRDKIKDGTGSDNEGGKGKGKEKAVMEEEEESDSEVEDRMLRDRSVVVFVCRHVYHRKCLEGLLEGVGTEGVEEERLKCVACT